MNATEYHIDSNHAELAINFGIGIGVFILLVIAGRLYRTIILDAKEKNQQTNSRETKKVIMNETFEARMEK